MNHTGLLVHTILLLKCLELHNNPDPKNTFANGFAEKYSSIDELNNKLEFAT